MRPYRNASAAQSAMERAGATARRREDFRDVEIVEVPDGYIGIDRQGYWWLVGASNLDPQTLDEDTRERLMPV